MARNPATKLPPLVRKHLSTIGAAGGAKSTHRYTPDTARQAVQARWAKARNAEAVLRRQEAVERARAMSGLKGEWHK